MPLTTSLVDDIINAAEGLHKSGTLGPRPLAALAKHLSKRRISCSAETGSGASTLLFSHCSDQHIAFTIDSDGGSVVNVQASPLLRPDHVVWILGPTQLTLPSYRFQHKLQAVLIDGPHAYPFPDLEYYYLYQHLETGTLLVIDDIQIPTIHNLFDFLRSDQMFVLEEVVDTTAFFTRSEAPMFCPIGDSWWEQQYNKTELHALEGTAEGPQATEAQDRDAGQATVPMLADTREVIRANIPIPPLELRQPTGLTDEALYDNPTGEFVYPNIRASLYESVFDFGCGCGRVARQLMLQRTPPGSYVGLDINRRQIEWCQQNLTAVNPAFRFEHHDVYNITMAPENSKNRVLPIPAADSSFSLVIAHSVFTHLLQGQGEFYLGELRRILRPDGLIRSTWFFFYREDFPGVLADHQNCLFVNETDPSQAVFYDYNYFLRLMKATGLELVSVLPPQQKNFQWEVWLQHARARVL